jgi:uracil-DNA glycosylase
LASDIAMSAKPGQQTDLFKASESPEVGGERLLGWQPAQWRVAPDWQPIVARFLAGEAAQRLGHFISARLACGATIYPPQPFHALDLTPFSAVRVVIVGQDPYHGPGQAQGLAFSVPSGIKLPPSLRNIFKELARETASREPRASPRPLPASGSLVRWAQQGVLLLNTCLTVEQGLPASHAGQGWEVLTDAIIQAVLTNDRPVVFMLWGAHAQSLGRRLQGQTGFAAAAAGGGRHLVLTANHPSPLSALRPPEPFIGCGHFGRANAFLQQQGQAPVLW